MNATTPTATTDPMEHARALHDTAMALGAAALDASRAIREAQDNGGDVEALRDTARAAWAAADDARAAEKAETARVRTTPVLGGPATISYPQDSYPAVVTRVTAKTVEVRMVEHGENESEWPIAESSGILDQPKGDPRRFTLRSNGAWVGVGGSPRDGVRVLFGYARYRRNYLD